MSIILMMYDSGPSERERGMFQNRISRLLSGQNLERGPRSACSAQGGLTFLVFPCGLAPAAWQLQVYQLAYERARAEMEQAPWRSPVVFSQNGPVVAHCP